MRASFLLSFLLVACGESHTAPDAGLDAGIGPGTDAAMDAAIDAGDCPPAIPCVDDTCCAEEAAAILGAGCVWSCPAGFVQAALCEPGPSCADFAAPCARNDECTLAITDCCGPCGEPSLDDLDAILMSRAADHAAFVCPDPAGAICPGCPSALNPNLGATCAGARCEGFDVRALDLSACVVDGDCRLRVRECCECGGTTDEFALIAVRGDAEADYAALVCDDFVCPECAPVYPDTAEAFCAADGHCDVRPTP